MKKLLAALFVLSPALHDSSLLFKSAAEAAFSYCLANRKKSAAAIPVKRKLADGQYRPADTRLQYSSMVHLHLL